MASNISKIERVSAPQMWVDLKLGQVGLGEPDHHLGQQKLRAFARGGGK